jgi:hypothetical protein
MYLLKLKDDTRSTCKNLKTFNQCMNNSLCGWCLLNNTSIAGCDSLNYLHSSECHNRTFEPITFQQTVELQPNDSNHEVSIGLTEGMTRNITLTFSLLPNPLDLYYLMDFSGSMSGDKSTLITIASQLMTVIGNISSDYRLGLGSFIDKPMSPFGASTEFSSLSLRRYYETKFLIIFIQLFL